MRKTILIEIIGIFFVVLLFSIVLLKYYDPNDSARIRQAIPRPLLIHGYDVKDVISEQNISLRVDSISLDAVENRENLNFTNAVPVLTFHGVLPNGAFPDVSVNLFTQQMLTLKQNGYQTISLDDFYAFLRGEKQLPEKSFLLTFDDGRKDSYYFTDDILRELNYTAVIFVVAHYSIEERHAYYLNLDELKKMEATGRWNIQSHSYEGHNRINITAEGTKGPFFGNKEWLAIEQRLETDAEYEARIRQDISHSKEMIQTALGHPVIGFAIPFGDYGQYITNFAGANKINEGIYRDFHNLIFYQYKPIKNRDFRANYNDISSTFYFVIRITVDGDTTPEDLLDKLEASDEISLPYTETFQNKFRWIQDWGNFQYQENRLELLNTGVDTSTTLGYLDGTYLLRDYVYLVDVARNENLSIALVSRFQNVDTYSSCIFNSNYVLFESVLNGVKLESIRTKLPTPLSFSNMRRLGMSVKGNEVKCLLDSLIVYNGTSTGMAAHGGVAIKSWAYGNSTSGIADVSGITLKEVR